MNYERERVLAERRAKEALPKGDWHLVAYNLFQASRMTLGLAQHSRGRTRTSLVRLAKHYETWGDNALSKGPRNGNDGQKTKLPCNGKDETDSAQSSWVVTEKPTTRLADVAGMEEVKETIASHIILPMKHADVYAEYRLQPGSGILMYGPPGTGKTFMARAIAGEVDAAFIPVEMKRVLSKWFGDTERLLGNLFEAAKSYPRTVVFFDEAEALFPKRGSNNSSVMARVVPQLLQLINGLDPTKNCVIMLAATNRPWLMDDAAVRPGRFGRLVYVGPPDKAARRHMIEQAMRETPVEGLDYESLAQRTEGYSGADIAGDRDSVCVEAKMAALKRTLERGPQSDPHPRKMEPVTMLDFQTALQKVSPSVRQDTLRRFKKFQDEHAKRS